MNEGGMWRYFASSGKPPNKTFSGRNFLIQLQHILIIDNVNIDSFLIIFVWNAIATRYFNTLFINGALIVQITFVLE